jgi:hypothetical protein
MDTYASNEYFQFIAGFQAQLLAMLVAGKILYSMGALVTMVLTFTILYR